MNCGRNLLRAGAMLLVAAGVSARGGDDPKRDSRSPTLEQLMPRWNVGDRWVVETASRPLQVRGNLPDARSRPIQWQFAVDKFEKSLEEDCFRVEIQCMSTADGHPQVVLWVDRTARAIRQIQTEIPVPGGYETVVENYEFPSGQPSPVLGLLSALPLDLPSFLADQGKGAQTFTYQTHSGPAGAKELGEVGFACQVEQQTATVPAENVKGLLDDSYTKGLESEPVVEVRLKGAVRSVRQLWRSSLPWPLYSESGDTTCRLVTILSANDKPKAPPEPQP